MRIDDLVVLNCDPLAETLAMEAHAKQHGDIADKPTGDAVAVTGLELQQPENPVSWIGRRVRGNR